MCANSTVDYIAAYFPYKTITKISEWPTYDTLKTLKKMIKAYASSVISDLGGGQHGHLGLVVPDVEYNRITDYTYTKPTHLGELKIKETTPLHKAIIMRELHIEKLNLFGETAAIKSAIKSQIVTAINPIYLRNSKTAH